jgi:hypothetical protein
MPAYLMKCEPDRDLYVEWSTVVDNLTWVGSRAEALRLGQTDEERVARTDRTGTSTLWRVEGYPQEGSWDDPTILVCNTERRDEGVYSYWLNRSDLTAFAEALAVDDVARAEALLAPNRHCQVCDTDREVSAKNLCPAHTATPEKAERQHVRECATNGCTTDCPPYVEPTPQSAEEVQP